jgi:outer membrane protein TolC
MRISTSLIIALLLITTQTANASAAGTADTVKLSLADAVDQALANNLGLHLQKDDVEAAEGAKEAARGEFDILFTGEGGAAGQENAPLATGLAEEERSGQWDIGLQKKFVTGTEVSLNWKNSRFSSTPQTYLIDPAYNSSLTLGIRQPLLQGFGIDTQTATLRASEKNVAAAKAMVGNEAVNLVAKVKGAYWNLVYAWQDREVKKLSVTLAEKLLEETKTKIKAGRLAEVDLYQPQSEVARREEGLISADRTIGVYEDELKLLLNSKDWLAPFFPADLPPIEPIQPDAAAVLENALKTRPDVQAATLNQEAMEIQESEAKDKTRPNLALVGLVGQGGTDDVYGDSLDDAIDDPETQWQAGFALSVPLQNSAAQGTYRQVKAAHSKARNSLQLLHLQVQQTVRTTVRDVQLAIKAMEATRKTSLATRKRLEAEQAKFEAGRATTLDVLTAQEAYSQALSQEKLTEVGYAQTLAELDRIQGLMPPLSSN